MLCTIKAVQSTFTKLTVKMKKSSTNTAPKGRIPAIRDLQKRDTPSKTDELLQCKSYLKPTQRMGEGTTLAPVSVLESGWFSQGAHKAASEIQSKIQQR